MDSRPGSRNELYRGSVIAVHLQQAFWLKEKVLARMREREGAAVASAPGCAEGDPLCDVQDCTPEEWLNRPSPPRRAENSVMRYAPFRLRPPDGAPCGRSGCPCPCKPSLRAIGHGCEAHALARIKARDESAMASVSFAPMTGLRCRPLIWPVSILSRAVLRPGPKTAETPTCRSTVQAVLR